ncbi:Alcohol dehydrogenase 3 [Giardia muris]|uniref:Alcohol dehydrogenase 3 n=1 Tax=Giardia muris TaxID=5742 RepID=A0A4Z1T0K1_GIAMU|nr:Alcohol dehydrogenase 3 [Giardia muris]|eukprot:TNJ27433.1 Alcohol dehydrogenase 3 [Giardia muris]
MPGCYESYDIERITRLVHGTSKGLFFGYGAIQMFGEILDDLKPSCVGFVTSPTAYKKCGLWSTITEQLAARKIPHLIYDKVTSNPTVEMADEAVKLFRTKYDKNFVVCSIGGGSPGDCAKYVAALLEHQNRTARELAMGKFLVERRCGLVVINLTHGTGTECDRYAVASVLTGEKHPLKLGTGAPALYPDYSIDDVNGMLSLSVEMLLYTTLDALNHVMEAATTMISTPYALTLAREAALLIANYLPRAVKNPQDRRARYWLTYAAALGGFAIDDSAAHLTHFLEHTLSAHKPSLHHGQGLAIIQPAVLKEIWPKSGAVLADFMGPIIGDFKGTPDEADKAGAALRKFLESVGFKDTLTTVGFKKEDLDALIVAVMEDPSYGQQQILSPASCTEEVARCIFESSF